MKDLINLDNIGNPEVLENITNWSEIKNHVKIRNEKGDDGKMYIYLDPQLEDLTVGMELEGTVRNVVDFGCFIDCGLHGDGLLHISKMTKGYIKHPSDMFSVGQLVKVYVYKVDLVKQKLQLTMFKNEE